MRNWLAPASFALNLATTALVGPSLANTPHTNTTSQKGNNPQADYSVPRPFGARVSWADLACCGPSQDLQLWRCGLALSDLRPLCLDPTTGRPRREGV